MSVRPHPATRVLAGILVAAGSVAGCQRAASFDDAASEEPAAIVGTVRGPEGSRPVEGRTVEVINLETGERRRAATDTAGGFSFQLKPGKYRVELTLRDGESLARQPGIIELNRSDADAHADFVFGTVRVSRPRAPAYRTDDGLGSPIA